MPVGDSNLTYTALGQPKAWAWANGDSAARSFDTDGRMTATEFASFGYDVASRITSISQNLWATSTVTELYQTPLNWTAGYDSRNRLTQLNRAGAETTYTYDANSNRLTAIDKVTSDTDLNGDFTEADFSQTTGQALNIDPASNKLLGFTQTLTKVRGTKTLSTLNSNVAYTLDANGALTSDGLRDFEYDDANRLSKVKVFKDGEAAKVRYLHNALGQRVFKSEPEAEQTLPNQAELGQGFIDWLKSNFKWLFAAGQANTSLGTAYLYADSALPTWALLGEYDNGSATGKGRTEYIWLPTEDGQAIPVGLFRNGKFFAIHTDHLGTPRLMTNEANQPVWQWPYSAFGNNKPTGVLKATPNPKAAITNQPTLLKATGATELNLRFPGQYADDESGLFYNYYRNYLASQGRYTQNDPIGLAGGLNLFGYASQNPLMFTDPMGLQSYMCAAGLSAWCPPPPKPPKPPSAGFNTDPCVQDYLKRHYGSFVADTMIPNFSGLSYVPGSGTAGQAWTSTAMSAGTKGVLVGAPYTFSSAVQAMGAAGAGVAGGSTSSALVATGAYAGAFAGAASAGLAVFGAATLPFSSAANAMALLHCSCRK